MKPVPARKYANAPIARIGISATASSTGRFTKARSAAANPRCSRSSGPRSPCPGIFSPIIAVAISGTTSHASRNEMMRALAIVIDNDLKKAPVTPLRNASGRKMTMVAADEPASGTVNSQAASLTRTANSPSVSARRRAMCSAITMTSSITRPTAAAMPPSVIRLNVSPRTCSTSTVVASAAGTTSSASAIMRVLRRNNHRIAPASSTPISNASRTVAAEAAIRSAWLYHSATVTPFGSRGLNASICADTSLTIAVVLPSLCWYTCISTASCPSAVTRIHWGVLPVVTRATSRTRTMPLAVALTTISPSAAVSSG